MRLCQIRSRDLLVLVLSFWKKFCAILWVTILQFLFELGLGTCQVYVWSKPISKPASTILVIFVIYEGRSTRDFLDKQALLKQFLGNIYILKNSVPASACRQCAEVWFPERWLEIKLSPGRNVCPVMFGIQQKGMSYINTVSAQIPNFWGRSLAISIDGLSVQVLSWCSWLSSFCINFLFFDPWYSNLCCEVTFGQWKT